jgi:hypothetical protein
VAKNRDFVIYIGINPLQKIESDGERFGERGLPGRKPFGVIGLDHVRTHEEIIGKTGPVVHVRIYVSAVKGAAILAFRTHAAARVVFDDDRLPAPPSIHVKANFGDKTHGFVA